MTKMYTQVPGTWDRLISRYGVRFESRELGTEAATLFRLSLDNEGNSVWEPVVAALPLMYSSEQEKEATAEGILNNYVRQMGRSKQPTLKVGDKVFHPKHKWSGVLLSVKDGNGIVDLGFLQTPVPIKELKKDRNQ